MKRALGYLALVMAVGCGGMVDGGGSDGVRQAESDVTCASGKIFVPDAERLKTSQPFANPVPTRESLREVIGTRRR